MTTLNTHELLIGDVLNCHGSRFRLTAQRVYPNGVIAFTTEYQGPTFIPNDESIEALRNSEAIPAHWRTDWIVQGNERARWHLLERPTTDHDGTLDRAERAGMRS